MAAAAFPLSENVMRQAHKTETTVARFLWHQLTGQRGRALTPANLGLVWSTEQQTGQTDANLGLTWSTEQQTRETFF
jgi:hypothetical protein